MLAALEPQGNNGPTMIKGGEMVCVEVVLIGAVPAVGGYKVLCAGYADVIGLGKPYLTAVSMMDIIWVVFTDRSHSRGKRLLISEAIGIYTINAFEGVKCDSGTHYFTVLCIAHSNE